LLTRFATRYGRTFTVLEDDGKKIPREKIAPYEAAGLKFFYFCTIERYVVRVAVDKGKSSYIHVAFKKVIPKFMKKYS
jgi:hypothetical protein